MEDILLVEDSRTFGSLMRRTVEREVGRPCHWVKSLAECSALLEAHPEPFAAALLDLNLPDAPEGEVVDLVRAHGLPAIVFTGELSEDLREAMWDKGIVDYVFKQGLHNLDYVVRLIRRILRNRGLKAVVADGSEPSRGHLARLLRAHGYLVREAARGEDALDLVLEDSDVRLLVTDHDLPGISGAELTRRVRETRSRRDVAIIGVSVEGDGSTSAAILKSGASDFIVKPFQTEELYCRVSQNVDMLNLMDDFAGMAESDVLTGLSNRKRLFEAGARLFAERRRTDRGFTAALLEIDGVEEANRAHGFDAGDAVLRRCAELLRERFAGAPLVARFAGKTFCVLLEAMEASQAQELFDAYRGDLAAHPTRYAGADIPTTASIGVRTTASTTFEAHLKAAEQLLALSREQGRDRVSVSQEPQPSGLLL